MEELAADGGEVVSLVMLGFAKKTGEAERESLRGEILAMFAAIDEVLEFSLVDARGLSPDSSDLLARMRFADVDAYQRYRVHELHVPVAARIAELCDRLAAVQISPSDL